METRNLSSFASLAEVGSFIEDLAESTHGTPTLEHVMPLVMRAALASMPHQEKRFKFSHHLCNRPERSAEKFSIELSENGAFELEWHFVQDGRVARLVIRSDDGEEYSAGLIFSPDVRADILKIVNWMLSSRQKEVGADLAAAN